MLTFRRFYLLALLAIMAQLFTACQIIGDIFKAGVWSGVILVVLVVGGIIFLISRVMS